jgi:ATP-dependent RNA helicase SUPV3L1/SUV3
VASAEAPAQEQKPGEGRRDRRDGPRRKQRKFDGVTPDRQDAQRSSSGDRSRQDRPRHERPRNERPREREKAIDPNSPFAALLELKARLEAEQKEKG